jgi:hypothetical protein
LVRRSNGQVVVTLADFLAIVFNLIAAFAAYVAFASLSHFGWGFLKKQLNVPRKVGH